MHLPQRTPRRARLRWIGGQAVLVLAAVFVYFQVRGVASAAPGKAYAHAGELSRFEQRLDLDLEDALQAPLRASHALTTLANWVYIWGHWPVIVATMVWLAWRHRPAFRRLRNAMLVSGALGLVVFVTYPVAPPRLAETGLVDTVTENSHAYRVLQPPNFVNQYAAMPSLHAGWDLLVGISIATMAASRYVRVLGCVLPVAMAYAVVATANHYLVDVVAGELLALLGLGAAVLLERRPSRIGRSP
jgi:hypothetical protein